MSDCNSNTAIAMQKRRVWLQMTNAGHTGAADMRKAKDPTPECPILDKLDRYEQTSRRTQAMMRDAMHMKKIRKDCLQPRNQSSERRPTTPRCLHVTMSELVSVQQGKQITTVSLPKRAISSTKMRTIARRCQRGHALSCKFYVWKAR